jgi:hypothetical protein
MHRSSENVAAIATAHLFGLAGLPAIGDHSTAPDGGGTDLCKALRTIHDGWDRWRR